MKNRYALIFAVLLFSACESDLEYETGNKRNAEKNETSNLENGDFIIGGNPVGPSDEVKATTVLVYDTRLRSLCTGSLLEKDVLITAAHCISGTADDVKIGFGLNISSTQLKPIREFVTHPKWRANFSDNESASDIALIRFNGELPKGYRPARLLSSRYKHKKDDVVLLAGFGVTKDVNASGEGRLRMAEVKVFNPTFTATEILLDQSEGKGACYGDSGGPAFLKNKDGKLDLWGVTSRGYGPNQRDCSGYSVYTKISSYSRWIKDAIETMRK